MDEGGGVGLEVTGGGVLGGAELHTSCSPMPSSVSGVHPKSGYDSGGHP